MLGPFLVDMELTPKQDLKLQFGCEYSLEFLTEREAAESDAVGNVAEVVSINGPQRLRKTRAFVVFGGRTTHSLGFLGCLLERFRRTVVANDSMSAVSEAIRCGWSAVPGRARAARRREPLPQGVRRAARSAIGQKVRNQARSAATVRHLSAALSARVERACALYRHVAIIQSFGGTPGQNVSD